MLLRSIRYLTNELFAIQPDPIPFVNLRCQYFDLRQKSPALLNDTRVLRCEIRVTLESA